VRLALMVQDDKTYKTTRQRDHTLDAQKTHKRPQAQSFQVLSYSENHTWGA
jgi:hypothetical protein